MEGKNVLVRPGEIAPPTTPLVVDLSAGPAPARPSPVPSVASASSSMDRVRVDGKFFRCGSQRWFIKGLTYGPFAPDAGGVFLPPPARVRADFAQVRDLGANAIRVYHTPPRWLLDEAQREGLRVFVDVPWEKHRCFLEDHGAQRNALRSVREAAELGDHPALLALSVVNEIPRDVVRFYGEQRIARFVRELLDAARQRAPECLLTYANYPSTEFFRAGPVDFFCFNVYLEQPEKLGAYLDRLQHLAGTAPLVLGEHGLDSMRNGPAAQARAIGQQVERVFSHGLAGSFVFSYTDDWFAGGEQVADWAFGVVDRARRPKPVAEALRRAWSRVPFATDEALPKVSVVVCSYNGAATLESCLRSLSRLRYPDYEVILIDDGSTDNTSEIARRFPDVRYGRQANMGLSAARNAGARLATGEIVAYTDSDCDADEDWLNYLVREMLRQNVDVIGGPNIPPPQDCNVARCVALSPGGPSHVMLDDRLAEHVPGCNMAFRRDKLLALGGFDEQFRQAGDDVDICWRFLDAGHRIGYASSAVVWHHRRTSVRAYLKQQAGYGRAEAMLYFKHPSRFNAVGSSVWNGVIYGEGATGLPWLPPVIYHGRFGTELFPAIYRSRGISSLAYFTLLEWHAGAVLALLLAVLYPPMAFIAATMWLLTLVPVMRAGLGASLQADAPWWSRPLVAGLHLVQPIVRAWHRNKFRLTRPRRRPAPLQEPNCDEPDLRELASRVKRLSPFAFDLYWTSTRGAGREALLEQTVQVAHERGWRGDFNCDWDAHDLLLLGDNWHGMEIRTASEELGGGKRFTRARVKLRASRLAIVAALVVALWSGVAGARHVHWAEWLGLGACAALTARLLVSHRGCRHAAARLLVEAGTRAALRGVDVVADPQADDSGAPADLDEEDVRPATSVG